VIEAADDAAIERAAHALARGELVAFPTETVYGLGADAGSREAVARVYALKGRPADHPLIVHVTGAAQAAHWARLDARALRLVARFWPGPLTLVLPLAEAAPAWACGGQRTVGLRCPSHPVARALLAAFERLGGRGVAAPSANRFGRVSPTTARHVLDDLGDDAPTILDGGPCEVGVESTILDLTRAHPVLLRPGRIDRRALADALGEPARERDAAAPRASGTLAAHYRPRTALELVDAGDLAGRLAALAGTQVAVWSVEPPACPEAGATVAHWEPMPAEAAALEAGLYAALRRLDRLGVARLLVQAPPPGAAWEAVRDRLARAAA
jgi:L-threonylcarbamoyladenylate synthase